MGEDLATAIEKITRDYTIGFGSFVDKELLPYISLKPGENCQQKGGKCPPPYRSGVNCQAGVNSPSPNFNLAKKRKKM